LTASGWISSSKSGRAGQGRVRLRHRRRRRAGPDGGAPGDLRPGITLDEVADVLWTYISVEFYELLVLLRGWTPERYAALVASAITDALIRPSV
jgi:hypothetical protein